MYRLYHKPTRTVLTKTGQWVDFAFSKVNHSDEQFMYTRLFELIDDFIFSRVILNDEMITLLQTLSQYHVQVLTRNDWVTWSPGMRGFEQYMTLEPIYHCTGFNRGLSTLIQSKEGSLVFLGSTPLQGPLDDVILNWTQSEIFDPVIVIHCKTDELLAQNLILYHDHILFTKSVKQLYEQI